MSEQIQIKIIETRNKQQVRDFCRFAFLIYHQIPEWVPPLQREIEAKLDRQKNPFFTHSDAGFFLAYSPSSGVVGRLAVLNNERYNDFNHEKTAFFTLFESINDNDVSRALFNAGFDWARERGLTQVMGPKGFNALDGLGLLIEGFELRPAFGIPYNPSYYPELVEDAGFQKDSDIVSGYMDAHTEFPEGIHEISRRVQSKRGLRVERFKHRIDILKLLPKMRDLYNDSLEGTQGNVPLTDDEVHSMANQLLWFADPRFIKILFKDETPVGYLFAYPDISAAIQRQKGRFFPLRLVRYAPGNEKDGMVKYQRCRHCRCLSGHGRDGHSFQ